MTSDSMDCVRCFNSQLASLYESKPPVSKAKMATITKAALKANKFYKHIVQSVEKFVLKCGQEYKIPGLYVIDSIVRQSRHQYGDEKDVFVNRFSKNIVTTFENIYKCADGDKAKVLRVLKLWLENKVFSQGIVKALINLGDDPTNPNHIAKIQAKIQSISGMTPTLAVQKKAEAERKKNKCKETDELLQLVTKLLNEKNVNNEAEQLMQLQNIQNKLLAQNNKSTNENENTFSNNEIIMQIQTLMEQLKPVIKASEVDTNSVIYDNSIVEPLNKEQTLNTISQNVNTSVSHPLIPVSNHNEAVFNKHLLDFDYGEDSESDTEYKRYNSQSPNCAKKMKLDNRSKRKKTFGLPATRENNISVCSTTIWLGHLTKGIQKEEISNEIMKYGEISNIDLVSPRGCAYITMADRKSASTLLRELKRSTILGYNLKLDWAQGIGVKDSNIKEAIWVKEDGVTYIPYDVLPEDLKKLSIGGWIDEDTLPPTKTMEPEIPIAEDIPIPETTVSPPMITTTTTTVVSQNQTILPQQIQAAIALNSLQQIANMLPPQPFHDTANGGNIHLNNVLQDILEKQLNDRQNQIQNGINQQVPIGVGPPPPPPPIIHNNLLRMPLMASSTSSQIPITNHNMNNILQANALRHPSNPGMVRMSERPPPLSDHLNFRQMIFTGIPHQQRQITPMNNINQPRIGWPKQQPNRWHDPNSGGNY